MTDPDSIGHNPTVDLSDRQRVAIESLMAAGTQTDAAVAAGVTRQTVNSWVNHHIGFIAELNQRRHEQTQLTAQKLQTAISAAIDNIEDRIKQGDFTLAMQLLKLVSVDHLLPLLAAGPRTPLSVENQLAFTTYGEMLMSATQPPSAQFLVQDLSDSAVDRNFSHENQDPIDDS